MNHYSSQFSASDTEYLYQQIEELKSHFSTEALFLIEEKETANGSRILFKVKDDGVLYQVDSSADNLLDAVFAAKHKLIQLICVNKPYVYEKASKVVNVFN